MDENAPVGDETRDEYFVRNHQKPHNVVKSSGIAGVIIVPREQWIKQPPTEPKKKGE